jgi:predicted ATPase/DNA-binding SARP family transcriptional activator
MIHPIARDFQALEIRLLGEFTLLRSGCELPTRTSTRARLLVARLALNPGHEFLRTELAAQLWPDSEPESARFSLRQLIAGLRRSAPELSHYLSSGDRTTLCLRDNGVSVDAIEFRAAAAAAPGRAVELYRGAFGKAIDDPWIEARRAEFEALYLDVLQRLADRSEPREAVGWLRKAIDADPYSEPLHQGLFRRLAECGDRSGLQAAYRKFVEFLHREMNLQPSQETERLYRFLISEKDAPVTQPPCKPVLTSRLPVPVNEIVGREGDLMEVCGHLASNRLVTILGPGGVGKTRLAIAVGEEQRSKRAGGVWFCDLSSVADQDHVASTVGRSLGMQASGNESWNQILVEGIASTSRLLIIDNCEHLLQACSELSGHLLGLCPNLSILATSRIPLGTAFEQRHVVEPLTLPTHEIFLDDSGPSVLHRFSAIRLFETCAKRVSPRFAVGVQNSGCVIRICNAVDCLPLGIEMATARLGALSLDELDRRLENSLSILRSRDQNLGKRHRSLEAVIQWSYDLLPAGARILLGRVSTFRGGWTLTACEAVCGLEKLPRESVLETLIELADASLVQRQGDRYFLLDSIRRFALDRLEESGESETCFDLHREFFRSLATGAESKIKGPEQLECLLELDAEHHNLRAALKFSLSRRNAIAALEMCSALWPYWQTRGAFLEAREWFVASFKIDAGPVRTLARAKALGWACDLARLQSDFKTATDFGEESLEIYSELCDSKGVAFSLSVLAIVAMLTGDYELGWCRQRQSLAIRRELGDSREIAISLTNLGITSLYRGDREAALAYQTEGLSLFQELGDQRSVCRSLTNIGNLFMFEGRLDAAQMNHSKVLALRRGFGDRSGVATSLNNLGLVLTLQGDYDQARVNFVEGLGILDEIGDRKGIAESLEGFARLELKLSNPARATTLLGAAESIRESISAMRAPHELPEYRAELATTRLSLGDLAFCELWTHGRSLSLQEAIGFALSK